MFDNTKCYVDETTKTDLGKDREKAKELDAQGHLITRVFYNSVEDCYDSEIFRVEEWER